MSSSNAVAALHNYTKVGPFFVGTPTSGPAQVQVVLIFGWMNGKMQFVNKYATYYRERGYTVLVNLSRSQDFFLSGPAFKEAIPYLESLGILEGGKNKAIVHAFSNGGTVNLRHLTETLKRFKTSLHTSRHHPRLHPPETTITTPPSQPSP
ncbi:hypothetical protein BC829DRAFT_493542 [Chytridium lagenaria]|nr:hypothetical protein BC829DRAFT_493542 [Chytridium lagenaria]